MAESIIAASEHTTFETAAEYACTRVPAVSPAARVHEMRSALLG